MIWLRSRAWAGKRLALAGTVLAAVAVAVVVLVAALSAPAARSHAGGTHPGGPHTALPGTITTVAGGVGGPGPAATVPVYPCTVSYARGALYAGDGEVIRRIDARTGWLTSPAGDGLADDRGLGGLATFAELDETGGAGPTCGLAATLDAAGNMVIADGEILVVPAGDGTFYGQHMLARHIYRIGGERFGGEDVAVDPAGNVVTISTDTSECNGCAYTPGQVFVLAERTGTFYGVPMQAGNTYLVAGKNEQASAMGNGGPANSAALGELNQLALDAVGNLVIADAGRTDQDGHPVVLPQIRVVAARTGEFYGQQMTAGHIYAIAGGGDSTADGVPATSAVVGARGVTTDHTGNVVVSDGTRLRVIAARSGRFYGQRMTAGDIYTVAGRGAPGGPGSAPDMGTVAVDGAGNLVFGGDGRIGVVAGRTGTFYGVAMKARHIYPITAPQGWRSGPAAKTQLPSGPASVAADHAGDMVIGFIDHEPTFVPARAGTFFGRRMVAGHVYLVPTAGSPFRPVAGEAATDRSGNVLIAVQGENLLLAEPAHTGTYYGRHMTAGHLYAIAGDGKPKGPDDGVPALSGSFRPFQVTTDSRGDIFIVDNPGTVTSERVLMLAERSGRLFGRTVKAGDLYRVAGNGHHVSDGGPATTSQVAAFGAAIDPAGNLVLASDFRIRVVAARSGTFYGQPMKAGDIYTIAGPFPGAHSVAIGRRGNILLLDTVTTQVRMYAVRSGTFYGQHVTAGHTYVVAGHWHGRANLGDGGPATLAWLGDPQDIATGPGGRLLIADTSGGRIRAVSP
jgi:hypothetical protein